MMKTMQSIDLKMNKTTKCGGQSNGPVKMKKSRRCFHQAIHLNVIRRIGASLSTLFISMTLFLLVQCLDKVQGDRKLVESSTQVDSNQNEAGPVNIEHLLDPIFIAHRRGKLDDGDGFIMRAGNGEQQNLTPATSQLPDEELITTTQTDKPVTISDELDQIPINATRQHFLTHDQLITSGSREDHQANLQQQQASSKGSRSAMPRLSLFTDLFKSRQQPAGPIGPQDDQQAATSQQQNKQQTSANKCPGICLNVLTAAYRCQNALPAPCPFLFQRCCETDRVPFDGTPVETSAPIFAPDSDPTSTQSVANVHKSSLPNETDATESLPENLRAPTNAKNSTGAQHGGDGLRESGAEPPSDEQQQQQQTLSPISRLHPTTEPPKGAVVEPEPGEHLLKPAGNQLHDDDQSRSIYFLSSGADSATATADDRRHQQQQQAPIAPEQPEQGQHLGQQHKLSPTRPTATDLAQHASDPKPVASQSFDSPLSSTTTSTTTTTNAPGSSGERMIMIQTVNGTALWHRGQLTPSAIQSVIRQSSRPLYANRSDFQQKQQQMHSRQSQLNPVVYHSNTDPVRRYAAQELTSSINSVGSSSTTAGPIDFSGGRQAAATQPPTSTTTATPDPDLKVLKDQHSAAAGSRQQSSDAAVNSIPADTQSDHGNTAQISTQANAAGSALDLAPATAPTTTTTSMASEETSQMAADQQQVAEQGGGDNSAIGIASFLGSLLYNYMSAPDSSTNLTETNAGHENEARAPFDSPTSNQHNDRRLGLDPTGVLSQANFDNNQTQAQTQYAATTSDNLNAQNENVASNQQDDDAAYRCDHQQPDGAYSCVNLLFTKQCDLSYQSNDCPPLSRCCVDTSKLAPCNGQCLPMFMRSVCTEPNQIQTSNCPTNTICCSSASSSSSSSSSGSDRNLAESAYSNSDAGSEADSRNQLLPIGLVPQPTIVNANSLNEAQQQQTALAASNRYAQANLFNQQQSSPQVASATPPAAQSSGSGLINQIFQYVFKSNSNGNKQRTRQQAPQTPPPQQQTQPMVGFDPQAGLHRHQVNFQQVPQTPQLVASATNLAATSLIQSPILQQQQHQQQAFATMRNQVNLQQQSPALMAPGTSGGQTAFVMAPQSLPANYHQGLLMNRNKQANSNGAESYLMQKQFGQQQPNRQTQLHPHPTPPFMTAEQQQQQVALMNAAVTNQMNFMMTHPHPHQQQQQQQTLQANVNRATFQQQAKPAQINPKLVPVVQSNVNSHPFQQQPAVNFGQQQQPTRWTYSAHLAPSDLVPASANAQQQQQQVSIRQQNQPNNVRQFDHNQANSFKPLIGHTNNNNQVGQLNHWTATSSLGHERPNLDQQQPVGERRLKPVAETDGVSSQFASVVVANSRPHNPETADTDIVSAMPQQSTAVDKRAQWHKFVPSHQDQQHVRPETVQKVDATNSATSPAATNARRPASGDQLGSASSNMSPTHANSDELDDGDDSDSAPTQSQAAPLDDSSAANLPSFGSESTSLITELSFTQQPPGATTMMSEPELIVAEDAAAGATEPTLLVPNKSYNQQVSSSTTTDSSAVELSQQPNKVLTTCGLPGSSRLDARLNSVAGKARSGRVMGGFESVPGYWCWQVALMNDKNEYLCGGALIGTKWVLTAAHCVTERLRNEARLYVRLGQSNLNTTNPDERRAARNVLVRKSYVHHNHNDKTMDNDIALLALDEAVDLSAPNICTICLPEHNKVNGKQLEPGRRCTVTGYGYESEEGPATLRIHQVDLPLVDDVECQSKLSAGLQRPVALPQSSFCAGGELGKDACTGDGGSPLFCLQNDYYVLEGLVSWGYGCGKMSGLFAKVGNFVSWINQIVSVNS